MKKIQKTCKNCRMRPLCRIFNSISRALDIGCREDVFTKEPNLLGLMATRCKLYSQMDENEIAEMEISNDWKTRL